MCVLWVCFANSQTYNSSSIFAASRARASSAGTAAGGSRGRGKPKASRLNAMLEKLEANDPSAAEVDLRYEMIGTCRPLP